MRSYARIALTTLLSLVFLGATVFANAFDKGEKEDRDRNEEKGRKEERNRAGRLNNEEIMKRLYGKDNDRLFKKVTDGKASVAEQKEMLALFEALAKNRPERGSKESWKEKTDALVVAAKDVIAKKDGAILDLKMASDCRACHKEHREREER
jgi:hypothetical protein